METVLDNYMLKLQHLYWFEVGTAITGPFLIILKYFLKHQNTPSI